jgi:hypothetical protein
VSKAKRCAFSVGALRYQASSDFSGPYGDDATPQWIEGHIDEMLATIERLWGEAMCGPIACAYLERME